MKHKTQTFRFVDMSRGGFARLFLLLLLSCLSIIGVKAADSDGGVKFNSAVRYSQWAINSRLHDFYGNQKAYGFAKWNSVTGSLEGYANQTNMKLDYVAGLVGKATLEASDYYVDFDWAKPWFKSAQAYATDYNYSAQGQTKMTLDNMNAAKMAFHIINNRKWGEDAAKTAAKNAIEAIITDLRYYNENYVIGGTKSNVKEATANDVQKKMLGGWFHKYNYVDQVWCDGMYMGPALLAQLINYKNATNNVSNDDWSLLTKQFSITWEQLRDSKTGLLYHGMTATPTITDWSKDATPTSYHSGAFWGRANAWYMLALVDVLELMPTSNTNYSTLKGYLEKLAASIASYQNADGTWYQVLDQKDNALNGNYEESSCSALFTAAYLKALRLKLLESSKYETMAKKAYVALVNKFMAYDKNDNNKIQILGSCCSAGLGTNSNSLRDGSRSYYINGNDSKAVTGENTGYYYTEGKVLGGFIMAATEYERAYQNQDSKQILFARDLAKNYNFSTTPEGTLDATAYGDGTVSYQWYKDGEAIANAKSATYTPTENGSYYCEATANGNTTIKTSETKVTAKSNSNTDNGSTDNNNGGSENGTTSGVIFSYTINTSEAAAKTPYNAKGGTVTLGAAKVDANGFKSDDDLGTSKYILVSLNNNTLKEGDVITIAIECPSKNGGLLASSDKQNKTILAGNVAKGTSEINYTVTSEDVLNSKNSFYLYRNGTSTYIKSITITRAAKKYKVSATAKDGGSVSIKNGSSATVTSGTEVEANTSLTFTATPSEGYDFINWTDASNTEVSTNATYTTTVSAKISLTANFKAKTTVDPTESEVIYDLTGSVGTTTDGTNCTTANKVITFSSNFSANDGKYITIKPKAGGFKAGDVITLKGYCNSKNLSGVIIYDDLKGNSIFKSNVLAKSTDGGSEFTFTLTQDCNALYLGRFGRGTTCLISLKVERPASSSGKTRLTASFEHNADVVVKTTQTQTIPLPALTVKVGGKTLTSDQYTVVYKSNAEDVATLNNDNTITIHKLGIATITATVTPTDANTYEGTTATYQLSVKAPSPLNVSVMDVTINTTDAEEEQPVIKVYGDNDKLLKLGQDYTLSFAVSGDNVTVDEKTGKFSVKKNAGKFIKGTSLITVTATPIGSLRSNYTEGTLQFSYSVSEGKIKPVFSDSFKGITIKLHKDSKNRTITVPLIYNGEEVSSYFNYTYSIKTQVNGQVKDVTENTLNYTPSTEGNYTITVTAVPGQNGEDNYGDVYDSPDPISFDLDVNSTYQVITVTPDPTNIKMYAGTTQVAPDLTVTNGNATLADTDYNTLWFSTSPGVVKVDAKTGKLEAVSEGNANIRVVVTGDNLESTTALITVDVDDPAVYRVHANEEYKSQKTMWNQDENLFVTLGGWLFPNPVKDLWPTDESLSNTVEWNYDSTQKNYKARKAPWKITGFDYIVKAGDRQKNARQENGSNSMPETTLISNVDYTNKKYIVDPMFNVPCSGSFLTFQPKTNGTVVAHIYQNGVFDSKKKNDNTIDYQYRPQRRVFIMDEAGNFVSSDAHIESTTGKPNGKNYDLTQYKWDMGDKQSPTVETVKKHFGLESFEMSETGFKNNVYENQLDQTIAPNEAATKYPNLKGSRGWSVLADAPVTYTFKVKAGKTYYLYNFGSKIGFYGFSFDEGETKPTVDLVNYNADDENANNEVVKTAEGHVAQVKIARKMVANRWTTCVLPFSLNRDQVDAIFGPAYCAEHPQGTQILYFDRIEGNKAYFVRHAYNTIVAGKPFLIKPTKDVESINTADVTHYPYVTIENTEPNDWCESNGYVWTSSYNKMNIVKNDYFIGASDGNFKAYAAASGTVKGFRGFLKAKLPTGAKPVMLSISTSSVTDGNDGETTGIEDLIITTDGELVPANSRVYNINGQLVSEDASSFQSLPSGVYIINGKKYIK